MAPAHENTLSLAEADEHTEGTPATRRIEWGKHISADDLKEIREERIRWRKGTTKTAQQMAKMRLFACSLFLEDDDFEGTYKELQEWYEDVEKNKKRILESKKMVEQAKKVAARKMELAMEKKAAEDDEKKKRDNLPKLPEPKALSTPITKPAPPVAPSVKQPIRFDPMTGPDDPNCICASPHFHPGRPCPKFLENQAKVQQGQKRKAQRAPDEHHKKKKGPYVPLGGDWKCGSCGYWNHRFWRTCRGKRGKDEMARPCIALRDDDEYNHQVQQEGEGIPRRKGGKFSGDWLCKTCSYWNRWFWSRCSACYKHIDEVLEEMDRDDSLPDPPDKPYDGPRNDWGPDNQKTVDRTSYESRSARYITCKKK
ncbi:uncharacterized protein K460DRAFT_408390 [Cucurbitaria berberidis CBS 394.84]|uniref:RanBP2-type domain-containing protein n=1 Tax=Cucurbitaria berberidis CBS 394.84 TaxID=1168544 RepID=A0A9P4L796_9PLEO|nr:uncharacterized protein K460DRAFT_408390 [Cucurbitaria berberidis CBS 394.84]KAF1844084.1 hypothetical protein K460DRAFT_408390 [Cucurbitaria berberidis CBS 394.84]